MLKNIQKIDYPERHKISRDIIALSRAAIAGFSFHKNYDAIKNIINMFIPWSNEIKRVGGFKNSYDYDLIYIPEAEMPIVAKMMEMLITENQIVSSVLGYYTNQAALHGMLDLQSIREEYKQTPFD
ncbi:MAG: hypothetical protein ACFFC1_20595 [Promethearchaeota archaeon]